MRVRIPNEFLQRARRKSHAEKGQIAKAIEYLRDARQHQASLQAKKLAGTNIWYARAGLSGRVTFEYAPDGMIVLRTNCDHADVLRSP